MPCEELDIVWNNIKAEARALADCEPMLASFYHATLLKHENLGSALSYMLANKLASPIMPAIAIREVVEEAYAADPEMIASAACDIQAVRTRDPAVDKYSTPLLYLKGFHALQAYRIGHWLWTQGRRALAIFLQNQVSVSFQVDIHLERDGDLILQENRQRASPLSPQPVADTIGLQGMETLQIEQRRGVFIHRRVARAHRLNIAGGGGDHFRIGGVGLFHHFANGDRRHNRGSQLVGQHIAQRAAEIFMLE